MIKKTYLLLTITLFCNFLFAQEEIDPKDELLNQIAIETCECVNKKDIDFSAMNHLL